MGTQDWLLDDENVLHEFESVWPSLFVTDKRIVAREGSFSKETLWEVGREHVSGASSFRKVRGGVMAAGGLLVGLGIFLLLFRSVLIGLVVTLFGVIVIAVGALTGQKGLSIFADSGQEMKFKVMGWGTTADVIKILREG